MGIQIQERLDEESATIMRTRMTLMKVTSHMLRQRSSVGKILDKEVSVSQSLFNFKSRSKQFDRLHGTSEG